MTPAELMQMPVAELEEQVQRLRSEVFNLRFKAVTEPVTDPAGLRRKRKQIAVIRTVLTVKRRDDQGVKPSRKLSRAARLMQREKEQRVALQAAKRARRLSPKGAQGKTTG